MAELNIGHSIVSRAVFVGLTQAVREMKECIIRAKSVQTRARVNSRWHLGIVAARCCPYPCPRT